MQDTTIKLIFSGTIALSGMIAALATTITGMAMEWEVVQILAVNLVFSNVIVAAMAFFFGHSNGFKNGQKAKT